MSKIELAQLKDYLRLAALNCSMKYIATEYWINKYWKNKKDLEKIKKWGECDHEISIKLGNYD